MATPFSLYPLPPTSISHLHFLSPPHPRFLSPPPAIEDLHSLGPGKINGLISPPSAHSNPKLLKTNRRSRYGEPLSVYDTDVEDEEILDIEGSSSGNLVDNGDGDGDDFDWFSNDEDEFAEPANLNRGQQRSKLLLATQLRSGPRKKTNTAGTRTGGKGKLGGNDAAKKKYSQLAEEFRLDNSWIPLLDYLSTFGMKETHFIQMYKRHVNAFHTNVCSARERLEYLLDVGVKNKDIKKILLRQPQILQYTVDNNLKSHVAFLSDLGIPESKIGPVITAAPSIFSYSVENSLKPTVRYLIEEVGIREGDLAKVVTLSPQILVQRVDISWNDRYDFLAEELGATKESILKMVTKHPQILHYSIEDGFAQVKFPEEHWHD